MAIRRLKAEYSRWDGTQDPFGPDIDIGELIDELSDDIFSGAGPSGAIRRLMQRGMQGRMRGLRDIKSRLRDRMQTAANSLNLDGPLNEVREKLGEILEIERAELSAIEGEAARAKEAYLDLLPGDPARQLRELMEYTFENMEARRRFEELVEKIRAEVMNSHFSQLTGAMGRVTPDDVARVRQMLAELNQMIADRERGEPFDFQGFMQRYGDMFPEHPKSHDELLETLARRMAAMSRLLASLDPEQQRQLQELAESVMGDLDFAFEMSMLRDELRSLLPNLPWDDGVPAWGDEPSSMSAAVDAIEGIGELEELSETLRGDYPGARIEDVDEDKLRRHLGEDSVKDLRRLKQIEKALEDAGILSRNKGRLELTPRGMRRLGERALIKIFEDMRLDRIGGHESRESGGGAEPTGATRPWRFGDTGEFAVQRTVFNAILRSVGRGDRGSLPKLDHEDFELVEAETRTRTATALLLDLSFSMPLRGHWGPAKRMALALHALIEGKYPQDDLYLIGFSDYARRLQTRDLTSEGPLERVYGTNMQHAFMLARRLLSEHPRAARQVIMVTDGEPTAHLVDAPGGSGPHAVFSWPPTRVTIEKTLAEAVRLSSAGITLNIFMLEDDPGLASFMEKLARRTGGRVFRAAGGDIGRFVLSDFVRSR